MDIREKIKQQLNHLRNYEDLKQYITNILYYAHIEAKAMSSIQFDKWVEEMIEGIDGYFKSIKAQQPSDERFYSDKFEQST